MIAAGFIWLTGCAENNKPQDNEQPYSPEIEPDAGLEDAGGIDADADDAVHDAADTPDSTSDVGDEDAAMTDIADSGGESDAGEQRPNTPDAPGASRFMDAPCAYPASLSYDAASDALITTCGGQPNALFRSSPLAEGKNGTWNPIGQADGYPAHHIQLSEQFFLITHSDFADPLKDGFTIVNADTGAASAVILLSALTLVDEGGNPLGFMPNKPAGAVLVGGTLCVAPNNTDVVDMDPANTTYHPGMVVCLPYGGDGTVDTTTPSVHFTSGVNTTGMAKLSGESFVVLSSNNYAPEAGEEAALDRFELPAMARTTTKLGEITAQIAAALAVTESDQVFIGVQKPEARLVGVDPLTGAVVLDRTTEAIENFITGVNAWDSVLAATDFGIFGQGGRVLFVDSDPAGWEGIPVTPLTGAGGPSVVVGDKLYQVVTANEGTSASVWRVDLSGLK